MQGVGLVSPGIASPFRHPNQYYQKVKRIAGSNLLTYWPQWEIVGAVAHDISGNSPAGERDGAYTGVTLAQPGIGDGNLAPFYDGANDFTNVFSASLDGVFNGAEGTMAIWIRVTDWTDGITRVVFRIAVDGSNAIALQKSSTNNRFDFFYTAGGTSENQLTSGLVSTDWIHVAITWSVSAGGSGEVRYYIDGAQTGATDTGLGVWVGNLGVASTIIGANTTAPSFVWDGFAAHALVMGRPATPDEMVSFASRDDD